MYSSSNPFNNMNEEKQSNWFKEIDHVNQRFHSTKSPKLVKRLNIVCFTLTVFVIIGATLADSLGLEQFSIDATEYLNMISPFNIPTQDAYVDPDGLIRSRHFVPETHVVTTKDNYIITMHRIVNPAIPVHLRRLLKPIILHHGLFTSSFNFLISSDRNNDMPKFEPRDLFRVKALSDTSPYAPFNWQGMLESWHDIASAKLGSHLHNNLLFPEGISNISNALGFALANAAFDVWMPNSRGSTYSLNHTRYDYRHDWRYWDFSFHEMALYDLPACIDYVLSYRHRPNLGFLGHSQGNLLMFILQSYNPSYWATKVKPFIAMAPIVYVPNVYLGIPRILLKLISPILKPRTVNEFLKGRILPKDPLFIKASDVLCIPKWSLPLCDMFLTLLLGNNFLRSNGTNTVNTMHHIPEGTSILNVLHFGLLVESGEFRAFNFGPAENMRRYGTPSNPFYRLEDINSPDIAFISSSTDSLATVSNVALTKSKLKVKLMNDYFVPELWWGHADYMYNIGAGRLANTHIINLFNRYRLS